jgi:signal transduction histidine kinase
MKRPSRFSRRQALALVSFLVPLAVLAVLGWQELRRGSELTQEALQRDARQFLASARQAVDQQLDLQVLPALAASQRLVFEHSWIRTALMLRESFVAVDDIVLLDEEAGLVEPTLAPVDVSLPTARDPQRGSDNPMRSSLAAAELLLTRGHHEQAMARLRDLIDVLETANPSGSGRLELGETEVHARFRLAGALMKTGHVDEARQQFVRVKKAAADFPRSYRFDADMPSFGLVATATLAQLGTPEARLEVLTDIAENRYSPVPDGLAAAMAERLAATFAPFDPQRERVDRLLAENNQRIATRDYAATAYDLVLKYSLKSRRRPRPGIDGDSAIELPAEERVVAKLGTEASLLAVRPATDDERRRFQCSHVGINFDLDRLLAPALEPFLAGGGNFVLAVLDQDVNLVEPPASVPAGFDLQWTETNGLTLRAYPADPARILDEARGGNRARTALLILLFVTALGGALWSWRTAAREAELASLKIDLVSRVSHELKTPLALIRMYGETLGMGRARDQAQASDFGTIIARESERLTVLIQRILDFSRQQAGTLEYQPERHDLGALLRQIAGAYAPHLEAKGALLIDDLPPDITVRCDANAAESAVVNLLENATKYGPDGPDGDEEHEIELVLRRAAGKAVIEVKDHGRGIPAAEREHVFDGFYRASNSGEVRGAGHGLRRVRPGARAPRGEIEALGRPEGGTIMRLTLPLADMPLADTPLADTPLADTPLADSDPRGTLT